MKEIYASNKQTPLFIRQQCGPRLSSVFRHTAFYDTRDETVFPTQGVYARVTSEIIGDRLSHYGAVKSDSHVEMNVPLFAGMSLQLCGRLGKIIENPKVMKPLAIDSIFFLGGPQSLRGFDGAGATTVEDGVPRGTRVYWATGIHLWTPLPFNQYFGGFGDLFRTHFFYNFGSCETLSLGEFRGIKVIHFSYLLMSNQQITCGSLAEWDWHLGSVEGPESNSTTVILSRDKIPIGLDLAFNLALVTNSYKRN